VICMALLGGAEAGRLDASVDEPCAAVELRGLAGHSGKGVLEHAASARVVVSSKPRVAYAEKGRPDRSGCCVETEAVGLVIYVSP